MVYYIYFVVLYSIQMNPSGIEYAQAGTGLATKTQLFWPI